MPPANSQPVSNRRDSADQRQFPRYPVRIDAVCATLRGAPQQPCEIRDLCLGGMLLNYPRETARSFLPAVGEQIDIRCAAPDETPGTLLRFRARVVRIDGDSAGVVLIDPDRNALQLLIDAAAPARRPDTADSATTARPAAALDSGGRRRLIESCKAKAVAIANPLMEDFIANAGGQLFDAADRARNAIEQNGYFNALGIINRAHDAILGNFSQAYKERLDATPQSASAAAGDAKPAATKLSLIEEEVLDDWLALADIANHIESRHQKELSALEQRLAQLYEVTIDKENNPFGPQAFATSFQVMLKKLELGRSANQIGYSTFKNVLLEHAGNLYADLNSHLIENGVLPDLKAAALQKQVDTRRAAGRDHPRDRQQRERSERGDHASAPRSGVDERDLYGIVRDLFSLRRQFGHHTAGQTNSFDLAPDAAPSGRGPATDDTLRPAVYTTAEILSTLSQLQASHTAQPPADAGGNGFHSRILSLVSNQGALGSGDKQIGGRESGIMYVAGNVFESLFKDMLLENSVRTWLQRLEIPLLKQAIADDSLFVDKTHVARQVVNKITQLELYGDGQGENAIQRQVNSLLNRIAEEIDVDPEIFSKALKKLNTLIQIQDLAFAENMQDVINLCESEEKSPATAPAQPAADEISFRDETHREWHKRATRLKPGSWVLFAADTPAPLRLRLAWVSKGHDRYVFVNLRGLKEKTLAIHQLTDLLCSGTARLLDGTDEPAMDRAQYNMLQGLHHQLLFETTHDQLTGLINRREFERLLQEKIEDARLTAATHSLMYIDIDQFNVINTTCGYDAGDRLLLEVGERLKTMTDQEVILGRIGADEFCLLLNNCSAAEAVHLAQTQTERMRDYRFTWKEQRLPVTFGIGLVEIDGSDPNAAQVLQTAEASCRAAKQQGVNRFQIHHPDDALLHDERRAMRWIPRIDKALEEGELDLRYQSIVPIAGEDTARPHHVEILLGVTDEDGSPISPQELIMAAEHYHRMPAIDRWVIRTTFAWMAENKDKVDAMGGVAINLSGRSLSDDTFKDFILEEVQKTGASMDRVCFEVTETAGIDNLTDAAEFILDMKKSGCTFALDDFGSGLSSYAYLKNLPVDFLKIDGAFVKEMDRNPSDFAVVKSISEIGHFMGKKIIAEYVENETILGMLREIGVDYAQGYVIDKPRRLFDFTG